MKRQSQSGRAEAADSRRWCHDGVAQVAEWRRRCGGGATEMKPGRWLCLRHTASSQSYGAGEKMVKSALGRPSCGAGSWGCIAAETLSLWQSCGGRAMAAEPWQQSQGGRVMERP